MYSNGKSHFRSAVLENPEDRSVVLSPVDSLDEELCKYCDWADLAFILIFFLTISQEDQLCV